MMTGKYSWASRWTTPFAIAATVVALTATAQGVIQVPEAPSAALTYEGVSDEFWVTDQLIAPLLAAAFLFSGLGSRLCDAISRRVGRRRYITVMLFAGSCVLLTQLVRAPVNYFWVRAHDRAAGPRFTALNDWLVGQLQDLVSILVGGVVVATSVYWLMARSPRRWWFHAAIPATAIVLGLLMMQPLTQSYEALGDIPVAHQIEALASRAGVPQDRIGIQHANDPTGCGAATVIGLGPTRRMLLDDTLVANYTDGEILESVAHESKHFVYDDNVKAFLLISAWLLCGLWLVDHVGRWAVSQWKTRFGFADLTSPASLPLAVLIFTAAYWVALPFGRAIQQTIVEQSADRFALDLTHDNLSEATLYIKDAKCYPLLNPSPGVFYQTLRATHPSIEQRIQFANSYHPWQGNPE